MNSTFEYWSSLIHVHVFPLVIFQGAQKIYLPHTPGRPLNVKQILRLN